MSKTKDEIGKEALEAVLLLKHAGIGVTMGGGKTLIGLRHMEANYSDTLRCLVAGPKNEVYTTWKEEADKHGLSYLKDHFEFTTYLSLTKLNPDDYDIIYLDECHSLKYSHEPWLANFKGIILGLTGTPPKYERSEKGRLVARFCPIVYKYITDDAVEDGILNDYQIIVHVMPISTIRNIPMYKAGKTWFTSERDTYEFWTRKIEEAPSSKMLQMARVMRMKAMQGFKTKEMFTKRLLPEITNKVLVFANTQEQADDLCAHSFHSKNPLSQENLDKFKRGEIKQLSCIHQLSEGVNVPDLREEIILHAYANERKSAQRIGRGLRLDPDDTAIIHILCYAETVDVDWVKAALADFDQTKIKWI